MTGLVMSAGTLGGGVTFVERVSSAAAAGFAGIGLTVGIVRRARAEGWTWSTMSGLLADNGLRVVELESVLERAVADRRLVERHCEKLFAIAEGDRRSLGIGLEPLPWGIPCATPRSTAKS
jgi:sugar phosphate isomerase/epimerase